MIELCGGQAKKTEAYEALCPSMPHVLIPGPPVSSEAGWLPLAACGDLGKPDLAGHNNNFWGRVGDRCSQGHVGRRATPALRTGERQVWEK